MALVEKAFGDIITFTRASGGGRVNASGQFEWVGTNVPRLTYDPVTLQPLGLWVEEQRTNLIRYSADFTNAAWSKGSGVSISTDGQIAPDGTPMQLITLAGTTNHNINQTLLAPLATGQAHTISVYVRPKSAPFPFQIAYYDGSTSLNATLITPIAGETQRIDFTFTPTVVAASPQIRILGFGNGGDGAQVYIWGTQPELGSAPSSYIPTTTAQVTRAADVATVNTLSPWYNAAEGTLVARVIRTAIGPSQTVCALSGGAGSYVSLEGGFGAPEYLRMQVQAGGVQSALVSAPIASVEGTPTSLAGSYRANFFAMSKDGAAPITDISGAVPIVTKLGIGNLNGGGVFNGIIASIEYYPRALTAAELQAITT